MSLLEIERRSRRAQRNHRKRQDRKQKVRGPSVGIGHNLGPPLAPLLDDRCLTFNEWCSLNARAPSRYIADLGREPAAASGTSDNILRDQLAENGATDAEIAILLRERVELNVMASDVLIEMIERKLREYGLQKVIPDDDLLGEAYQEFHRSKELREQFAEMESEFKESKIDVPKNLRNEVRATLKKNPDLRWDDAIQVVLDGTQLDHVRSKKQKAKKEIRRLHECRRRRRRRVVTRAHPHGRVSINPRTDPRRCRAAPETAGAYASCPQDFSRSVGDA